MDITTLLGLIIGITVVSLAVLSGSSMWIFINIPGLAIVLGGTFAATLIKFPLSQVFTALMLGIKAAFVGERESPHDLVNLTVECARRMRKDGPLALAKVHVDNAFFKKGLRYCIDGYNPDISRKAMLSEMELTIRHHEMGERIFRAVGESAPAFGMIGTLVGLVQMLSNMSDPKAIGPAMAIALLTTLYGALIANLIALPIADKLGTKTEMERVIMNLVIEGVSLINEKQNPNIIEELLQPYLLETKAAVKKAAAAPAGDTPPPVAK